MTTQTTTGHRETELVTIGILGLQNEACHAQPADHHFLSTVAALEDAQQASRETLAVIDRCLGVLVLQLALARCAKTRRAQVLTRRCGITLRFKRAVHQFLQTP